MDEFRVLGEVESIETIAEGNEIRDLPRLLRIYGFAERVNDSETATVRI